MIMSEDKRLKNLISFTSDQSHEEAVKNGKKGGKASGVARRRKRDMRELMKMMLEETPKGKELTYSESLTKSMLTIASNPKQGAAAVRAYETILHIIGQDEPEPKQDAIDLLKTILKENRKNAELPSEQETE